MKKFARFSIIMLFILTMVGCSEKTSYCKTVAEPFSNEKRSCFGLSQPCDDFNAENLQAFQREDGSRSLYLYSAAIEQTCNEIKESEESYQANGTYFNKSFPKCLSENTPIEIGGSKNFAKIYLQDQILSGRLTDYRNAFGLDRQAVVYENAFGKGNDYICYPTSFGVNTEIVISKRTESNQYQMKVQLPDLAPDTDSPDYILFRTALKSNAVKSILYTPLAIDANGKWSYANSVKLIEKDSVTNTYTVEYTVDQDFLQDENTKYPITLNQSVHLYKSKQPDTSAYENTGDEAGHYLSPYMLLGDSTIKGEGWTFIRYETLNLLDIEPEKVVSAKYVFRNLFDLEKEAKIGAYAVTEDWCSINTRWFNRPSFDETPMSEVIIQKAGDYELDVTTLLKEMITNKKRENAKYSVQNSFFIKSETHDSNMIFASGDNGLFSPMLEIVLSE